MAKTLWILEVQRSLESEKNFENMKQQLGLLRDQDGILKCKGRRGRPVSITTDNAKTFKWANRELGRLLKNERTQDFTANQGITWKFTLEKAPWWGSYYERMVQLVKRSLRKVLDTAFLRRTGNGPDRSGGGFQFTSPNICLLRYHGGTPNAISSSHWKKNLPNTTELNDDDE